MGIEVVFANAPSGTRAKAFLIENSSSSGIRKKVEDLIQSNFTDIDPDSYVVTRRGLIGKDIQVVFKTPLSEEEQSLFLNARPKANRVLIPYVEKLPVDSLLDLCLHKKNTFGTWAFFRDSKLIPKSGQENSSMNECEKMGCEFNRQQNPERREFFETYLVGHLQQKQELTLTSFASGHLQEELFILVALMEKGVKKIRINLIDRIYAKYIQNQKPVVGSFIGIFAEAVHQMAQRFNAKVEINLFESLESFTQDAKTFPELLSDAMIDVDSGNALWGQDNVLNTFKESLKPDGEVFSFTTSYALPLDAPSDFKTIKTGRSIIPYLVHAKKTEDGFELVRMQNSPIKKKAVNSSNDFLSFAYLAGIFLTVIGLSNTFLRFYS